MSSVLIPLVTGAECVGMMGVTPGGGHGIIAKYGLLADQII
jgi:hypothetical protein